MTSAPQNENKPIRLVIADVDGTLVTHDKILTQRAIQAVFKMREAGIQFAVTSGRPPKGMAMLVDPLKLDEPIAGFSPGIACGVSDAPPIFFFDHQRYFVSVSQDHERRIRARA